jgi:hypothetical protein
MSEAFNDYTLFADVGYWLKVAMALFVFISFVEFSVILQSTKSSNWSQTLLIAV